MPYRGVLGLCMAVCGTQNAVDANIESRIAAGRSFRYPGRVKNRGAVIMAADFRPSRTAPLISRRWFINHLRT